jgi:hypothetical protein
MERKMTDYFVPRVTATGDIDRRHDNPGRPAIFDDKWGIVEGLKIVRDAGLYHPKSDSPMSRQLTLKLVDMGYAQPVEIKGEGVGRPRKAYTLTGKARSYLALSKRWKQ